jgi:hypothetical protein
MEPSNLALFWAAVLACSILLYVFLDGAGVNPIITLWIAFVAGVAITFVWTWEQTSKQGLPPDWKQIVISTFAFVVWVIALGGPPFEINTAIGAILLIGFTLIAALSEPDGSADTV